MRVVKEANERKNEILDAAEALFAEKGFDHTSTNEILEAVGIAKGTLYHHFKSKEDIMDAIIERQSEQMLTAARKTASDRGIPVEERLIRVILALRLEETQGTGGKRIIEHLHRPQNALMHQKSKRIIMEQVPPILTIVLNDGIEQGLFDTPCPLECMEMVVAYLNTILDDGVIELTEEQRLGRIKAFLFNMERPLNVKEGKLHFIMKMFENDGRQE